MIEAAGMQCLSLPIDAFSRDRIGDADCEIIHACFMSDRTWFPIAGDNIVYDFYDIFGDRDVGELPRWVARDQRSPRGNWQVGNCRTVRVDDPITPEVYLYRAVGNRQPGPVRIASAGWAGVGDESFVEVCRMLRHAGHVVDIYPTRFQLGHPYLHQYREVANVKDHISNRDEYWRTLARYDYGLCALDCLTFGTHPQGGDNFLQYCSQCGSNRLADYQSVGLPVLISPGLDYQISLAGSRGLYELLKPGSVSVLSCPTPSRPRQNHIREGGLLLKSYYDKIMAEKSR